MGLIGLEIFVRHDDQLAGESVAESVEGRSQFAGLGAGAGGITGVGFIAFGNGHDVLLRSGSSMGFGGEGADENGRWLKSWELRRRAGREPAPLITAGRGPAPLITAGRGPAPIHHRGFTTSVLFASTFPNCMGKL